jgi:hypothetical protein
MKKPRTDGAAPEIKCDACGGTGRPPVKEVAPPAGSIRRHAQSAAAKDGYPKMAAADVPQRPAALGQADLQPVRSSKTPLDTKRRSQKRASPRAYRA